MARQSIRLAADIGGTFTDIALDCRGTMFSSKVLTNYRAPEQAILDGIEIVLRNASIGWPDLEIVIHGTTLVDERLDRATRFAHGPCDHRRVP